MRLRQFRPLLLGFIFLILSGCAPKTTIVLLPDPSGKVGHIQVANSAGAVDMTRSAEATVIADQESRPSAPKIVTEKEILTKFVTVLAVLPAQPEHFILYFQSESTELTTESQKMLPLIFQSIHNRRSESISVIGHTDTSGHNDYNLRLSHNRAAAVSQILTREGIPLDHVTATSHGEGNPLVKTADNAQEPRNRRVEVVIR